MAFCTVCSAVLIDSDKHSRCLFHRKCSRARPCKLDVDMPSAYWDEVETTLKVNSTVRKSSRSAPSTISKRPDSPPPSTHKQLAKGSVSGASNVLKDSSAKRTKVKQGDGSVNGNHLNLATLADTGSGPSGPASILARESHSVATGALTGFPVGSTDMQSEEIPPGGSSLVEPASGLITGTAGSARHGLIPAVALTGSGPARNNADVVVQGNQSARVVDNDLPRSTQVLNGQGTQVLHGQTNQVVNGQTTHVTDGPVTQVANGSASLACSVRCIHACPSARVLRKRFPLSINPCHVQGLFSRVASACLGLFRLVIVVRSAAYLYGVSTLLQLQSMANVQYHPF